MVRDMVEAAAHRDGAGTLSVRDAWRRDFTHPVRDPLPGPTATAGPPPGRPGRRRRGQRRTRTRPNDPDGVALRPRPAGILRGSARRLESNLHGTARPPDGRS